MKRKALPHAHDVQKKFKAEYWQSGYNGSVLWEALYPYFSTIFQEREEELDRICQQINEDNEDYLADIWYNFKTWSEEDTVKTFARIAKKREKYVIAYQQLIRDRRAVKCVSKKFSQ